MTHLQVEKRYDLGVCTGGRFTAWPVLKHSVHIGYFISLKPIKYRCPPTYSLASICLYCSQNTSWKSPEKQRFTFEESLFSCLLAGTHHFCYCAWPGCGPSVKFGERLRLFPLKARWMTFKESDIDAICAQIAVYKHQYWLETCKPMWRTIKETLFDRLG